MITLFGFPERTANAQPVRERPALPELHASERFDFLFHDRWQIRG